MPSADKLCKQFVPNAHADKPDISREGRDLNFGLSLLHVCNQRGLWCICADLPVPLLFTDGINIEIVCTEPFIFHQY